MTSKLFFFDDRLSSAKFKIEKLKYPHTERAQLVEAHQMALLCAQLCVVVLFFVNAVAQPDLDLFGVEIDSWAALAKECVSSVNVTLSKDFTMDGYTGDPINFDNPYKSELNLVIWGNNATFDAAIDTEARRGNGSFFVGGGSLELHNIFIKGGYRSSGGAICVGGQGALLMIYDCTFEFNTGSYGGAIYTHDGATAQIYSSTFRNNTASIVSESLTTRNPPPEQLFGVGWCYFCFQSLC
jgi:hypothetical protein